MIALTWLLGTITAIGSYSRQTNACSVNLRQHTWRNDKNRCRSYRSLERKQPLLNDSRVLKGRVHSGRHPRNVMLSGALVVRTLALKDLPSEHDGQNRLNSLAIVCIEYSYGNKVIINSMDKIINIFSDRATEGKTFFFSRLRRLCQ